MKIIFARHGQSEANVLGVFSNAHLNHPLTELGRSQASALVEILAPYDISAIYASPVLRARQTAEIVAESRSLPLTISPALSEWNVGIYEGTTDPEGWRLHAEVQQRWVNGELDPKMPGGESLREIQERFVPFINSLADLAGDDDVILCVAHGGVLTAGLPSLIPSLNRRWALTRNVDYTGLIVCERSDGEWTCLSWCGEEPNG